MKKHVFGIVTLSTIFALSAGLIVTANKPHKEADAYSATSLTTTIDLNDCTEQEIRSYYSNLNSLSTSERQGTNLLKNLKPILKNGQQYLNYDTGDNVWKIYEITDRDWEKSPASAISHGTYNSSTNEITNYTYGSSGDNPYVHALYVNRNVNNQTRAWGDHTQSNWGINREHIWAKSHGFQDKGAGGARGDPMHLWAGNGYANNIHSNNFFAFVDKSQSYTNCGSSYSYLKGNLSGQPKNAINNSSKDVFEPQDCDKGDIARAVFYMVARYNNYAGATSGIDTNDPNLVLANDMTQNDTTGTSTASRSYAMGLLSDLLAWNKLDPVDEYEIHRNNLLFRNYTKNRNPFIDFPEWADAIWGTANLDGTNYNSSITSYATPASDPIGSSSIPQTFSISSSSFNLEVGDTANLSARNAESTINWTVGNSSVVSLDKTSTSNNDPVTITALAVGTTTITATSGSDSATCTVTVSEPVIHDEPVTLFTADLTDTAVVTTRYSITTNAQDKAGYYQDVSNAGSQTYFKVMSTSPLFSSVPDTISFTASLGSGNNEDNLVNNVEVCLVDQSGNDIESTRRTLTTSINTTTQDYDVELPYNASAYGVKLYHVKTSGYNIRFFSFSLSYEGSTPIEPVPNDYLGNVSRIAGLYGNADISGTNHAPETITFGSLGLDNGVQYLEPFDGGDFTITFAGGVNDGKYYTTGSGIRTYGNGTITIASSLTMQQINFTWDSSSENKPSSDDVVDVGEYDSSTYIWTGSAESVTLTRPSGSGHWRLKSVTVTYVGQTISVIGMSFKFGITIPQDDWDAIADNWEISDYGVMIVKENTLQNVYHEDTVEDAHTAGKKLQDLHKGNGDTPYTYDANYLFTVKLNIGANIAHNLRFVASPYIVIDDVYYFLGEIRCSINELAATCLTTGETNLSDDALTYLTTH